MKRSLFISALLSTAAMAAPTSALGNVETSYYYAKSGKGTTLRFLTRSGHVEDITFSGFRTCRDGGKTVKPYYGRKEISSFGHGRLKPDGSFRRHSERLNSTYPGGPKLRFERTIEGKSFPGHRFAAIVRIKSDAITEAGDGIARCDTGKVPFVMERVSERRYEAIVDNSQVGAHTR